MDGDENDMIPVKDMTEKERYTRSMFHDKESSLVQERAGIAKLSREELEDRHLRLLEENQILKKHCHKQEDKIKRLATKLLRLVQDHKKTGEAFSRQRDPETAELIQSQQDQINQMERQITQFKDKLLVARQQVNTSQGGRPGRPLAVKADPLRRPSSRPSSKTSSQKRLPVGGVEPQLPPYAEQLLVEARQAAARLQQQTAALAERNRELDETFSTLREQCNMYEQEVEMLKEQSRVKELEHEEELEVLRNQANQANRSKLAENVEMIKLQRELKQTGSRLTALQTHAHNLEETLRTERPAYERAAREIGELTRLHEEEQSRSQQLQREASTASQAKQRLDEVEMSLKDAQRENELLRSANEKLSEIGSDTDWQREQQDNVSHLRAQLASVESSLRGEQARRRQLADQLTAEQQRSWRLQAEARDLQSQLLRPVMLPPPPPPVAPPAPAPAGMPEPPRPRPETRDKAVCTSPQRSEPEPERQGRQSEPERERRQSPPPAPPDTPTSELLSKIDTGEPLPRQLAALHCRYVETVQELEKTRTLLDVQKQINSGQQQELTMLNRRLTELRREREKAETELRSALQARTSRVMQLEARLREVAYRAPGQTGLPRPAVMDSSMQLEAGSCLLELHVERLALTPAARQKVGDAGVFLTWIFYNQDMHFTPVVRGSSSSSSFDLRFACSSLYKLQLDSALVHYLTHDLVTIEVQTTAGGSDCHRLATASISCREILDYPRNRLHGTAEVTGLGTLVYWFRADGALQEFLKTRGAGDAESAPGESDQTIVAGSPDICEPSVPVKPSKGPAAVSTPVRRQLAARAPVRAPAHTAAAAAAPAGTGGRQTKRASPRGVAVSDTEATESECSPERSARRPSASRARSEADMRRVPPRPDTRRQLAGGGGGDASPPRRAAPAPAPARAQQRRRESVAKSEADTPRRPPRRERRESGRTGAEREESDRVRPERPESTRETKERQESGAQREAERRSPKARPVGARLVRSGPAEPAEAERGSERGQKQRAEPAPQPPRPQPRTTGYATYTESSASEVSSLEEVGVVETPQQQQQQERKRQEKQQQQQQQERRQQQRLEKQQQEQQQQQQQQERKQQERRQPQQKQQQPPPVRGRQLQVGGSSPSVTDSGGGSVSPSDEDHPPAADRSPLTAGRSPPLFPDRPRPRDRESRSPTPPAAWRGGGGSESGSGSDRSPERTVVPAERRGLQVAADVHRRPSETSVTPSTGTGTDSEGVVLHRARVDERSASEAVTITVHEVTLSPRAEVYRRTGGTGQRSGTAGERPRLFVEYRFLDVPPEELESPYSLPLPEPGEPLVFNFRKVISVAGRQQGARRRLLASELRPDAAEQGLLMFTVVAEPQDSEDEEAECTDVGYAQLSLTDVLSSGRDVSQSRLPLRSASGEPAGHLSVSLQALRALRAAAAAQAE